MKSIDRDPVSKTKKQKTNKVRIMDKNKKDYKTNLNIRK